MKNTPYLELAGGESSRFTVMPNQTGTHRESRPCIDPLREIGRSLSLLILCSVMPLAGCTKQVAASMQVMANKAEDQWVEVVGKGETALQLYRNRHDQLREHLIRIRAAIKSTERKLAQTNANVQEHRNGSPEALRMEESLAASYEKSLATFRAAEKSGAEALEKSRSGYETLKTRIELLDEQIANAKAMANFEELGKPGTSMAEINTLVASLEKEFDLAEATLSIKDANLE